MPPRESMHRPITNHPLAYFITMRTYGTWLHGNDRGCVDDSHNRYDTPLAPPNDQRLAFIRSRMQHDPMILAADSAQLVELTIQEVCNHRSWHLHIAKARTNHVHVVVAANNTAERVMNDFKAWATRRLREAGFIDHEQTVWVEHGSTPHLWTDPQVLGAIDYVRNWQGGPLQKTWAEVQKELAEKEDE